MKTLIAYFSRAGENYVDGTIKYISKGNNEILAEKLKNYLPDADMYKIEPLKPYSDNYKVCLDQSKEDLRIGARPALVNNLSSVADYDKIFLIYPIYWGTFPVHVFTFLESFDFAGKVIIPIATHEGSGFGSSEVDLRQLLPYSHIAEGVAIYGSKVSEADEILAKLATI